MLAQLKSGPPGGSLPQNLPRQAWQALADAANALLALASAALGESPGRSIVFHPTSFSLSHLPLQRLVRDFLAAKARAGRSQEYLDLLEKCLRAFQDGRASRPVTEITPAELEKWIHRPGRAARTRLGDWMMLRTLFNFAVRRGHLVKSPLDGVERPSVPPTRPGIHTPDQVRQVLQTARRGNLNLMRSLAIRYFAGLRTSEVAGLEEAHILLDQGFIEVTALNAKTRRRRLVKIEPNLRAWLAEGGQCQFGDANTRLAALVRASGVAWPHNVTRHSFVSYHLAAFGSAAKTALEAGHSEAMLFAHYRELVTPDQAKAFWEIMP